MPVILGFVFGAVVAAVAAMLCDLFATSARTSTEHAVARFSLIALATLPPMLAMYSAAGGALDSAATDPVLIATGLWLFLSVAFTEGLLHAAESHVARTRHHKHHTHRKQERRRVRAGVLAAR
jgi:hypothetical protein